MLNVLAHAGVAMGGALLAAVTVDVLVWEVQYL